MMATDSNMTSGQSTYSSINGRAAMLRIVNKCTDMETKKRKAAKRERETKQGQGPLKTCRGLL